MIMLDSQMVTALAALLASLSSLVWAVDMASGTRRGPSAWSLGDLWICWEVKLPKRWQIVNDHNAWRQPLTMSHAELADQERRCILEADRLRPSANLPSQGREVYRVTNKLMKPLLKNLGYRSFAEFEKAYQVRQ